MFGTLNRKSIVVRKFR
uniref:Uncharacterized protein n=1 Tax=Rhizophora mucronata TaxID=61149 RepID=A0A2P2P4R7_RHIMU